MPRTISSPKELFDALAERSDKQVYEAKDGSFWIDYGGGQVPVAVLEAALTMNLLTPTYPGCPECKSWRLKPRF